MLPRTRRRYQSIVERVQQLSIGMFGEPLHIACLCAACGVTERTLRDAFRAICGTTPYRYLREQRMLEARRALLHPCSAATVTSIATQFGFLELGRFSVEYRSVFGERPSDTLKRAVVPDGRDSRPSVRRDGLPLMFSDTVALPTRAHGWTVSH